VKARNEGRGVDFAALTESQPSTPILPSD